MGLTDKLDILMKERNISKADLARESGVPYTTIDGFYKKGSENAKLSTLKKLCNYFNCTFQRKSSPARNKADKGNSRCFRSYGNWYE